MKKRHLKAAGVTVGVMGVAGLIAWYPPLVAVIVIAAIYWAALAVV